MDYLPVCLTYNTDDLAINTGNQFGGMCMIVENGPNKPWYASASLGERKSWATAWNEVMSYVAHNFHDNEPEYVWMLNSDLQGLSMQMADDLYKVATMSGMNTAAITPAFNSPHRVFHRRSPTEGELWPREVHWIDWCCPLVSMKAWMEVGPFDDKTFTDYGADVDWSIRAKALGYKLWVYEPALVHHLGNQTAQREGIQWDLQRMQDGLGAKYGKPFEALV